MGPETSQDPGLFSHEHNHAGQCYELGVSLSTNQLLWMSGPHDAGNSDLAIFGDGLRRRLEHLDKKAIGDGGHNGEPHVI